MRNCAGCSRAAALRALALVAFAATCAISRADTVNVGTFSFDELIPGAVNSYAIINFTGTFSLPPDFPALTPITFKNPAVILTDDSGGVSAPILIDEIGPGVSTPPALEFLATQSFRSAELKATLGTSVFNLPGGKQFIASTTAIDALLVPGSGATLTPGLDLVPISMTGTITATAVPELSSGTLLLMSSVLMILVHRVRRRKYRRA